MAAQQNRLLWDLLEEAEASQQTSIQQRQPTYRAVVQSDDSPFTTASHALTRRQRALDEEHQITLGSIRAITTQEAFAQLNIGALGAMTINCYDTLHQSAVTAVERQASVAAAKDVHAYAKLVLQIGGNTMAQSYERAAQRISEIALRDPTPPQMPIQQGGRRKLTVGQRLSGVIDE